MLKAVKTVQKNEQGSPINCQELAVPFAGPFLGRSLLWNPFVEVFY